jgi:FkbM family methyltransferase
MIKKLNIHNYTQKIIVHRILGKKGANIVRWLNMILLFKLGKNYDLEPLYKEILKEGDFVFDIGANIGQSACRFSKYVKQSGRVFSFEPVSNNYKLLTMTIRFLNAKNVISHNYALGSTMGNKKIYIPSFKNSKIEVGTRASILYKPDEFENATIRSESVNMKTLDQVVQEQEITRIDLIKSDTEGNDIDVLDGAFESILKFNPILVIESNYDEDILKRYFEVGYTGYYFHNSKLIAAIGAESRYSDLVLIPETRKNSLKHLIT